MSEVSSTSPIRTKLNIKRLLFFLRHPGKFFEELAADRHAAWQLPMLLLSLTAVLRVVVTGILRTRAAAMGEITLPVDWQWWSPDMQNNYLQGIQATQGPAYVFIIPGVTSLIGLWLGWPIFASILHLISTLLGGRGSQASTMNAVAWSRLPFALRDLLRAVYMLAANHVITSPGLSGFLTNGAGLAGYFSNLLKYTDLFLAGSTILLAMGLYRLDGLSKSKTWLAVLLVTLLSLLAQAGVGAILSNLAGSTISRPFYF